MPGGMDFHEKNWEREMGTIHGLFFPLILHKITAGSFYTAEERKAFRSMSLDEQAAQPKRLSDDEFKARRKQIKPIVYREGKIAFEALQLGEHFNVLEFMDKIYLLI
jgi:hypothetical protein